MLIILESVGSVFDTSSMCIHPQTKEGGYDKECKTELEEIDLSDDWWESLSVEDFDTVNCCI